MIRNKRGKLPYICLYISLLFITISTSPAKVNCVSILDRPKDILKIMYNRKYVPLYSAFLALFGIIYGHYSLPTLSNNKVINIVEESALKDGKTIGDSDKETEISEISKAIIYLHYLDSKGKINNTDNLENIIARYREIVPVAYGVDVNADPAPYTKADNLGDLSSMKKMILIIIHLFSNKQSTFTNTMISFDLKKHWTSLITQINEHKEYINILPNIKYCNSSSKNGKTTISFNISNPTILGESENMEQILFIQLFELIKLNKFTKEDEKPSPAATQASRILRYLQDVITLKTYDENSNFALSTKRLKIKNELFSNMGKTSHDELPDVYRKNLNPDSY